ncbi:MAG: type III-A CRISPR-associated protein Csm2 [Chloroflexi bacterium]|jgi:CRISPR type III-A-associated protein Csm2|nr:type III-A CRISPR-associated protein Csm2 [Chloroflexota bacterium]
MPISDADMQKIVKEGDVHLLVEKAEELGKVLKGYATTTQIRRLFSTFRQIEMSWPHSAQTAEQQAQRDEAYRALILFGPRLEYQTQKHAGLRRLADALKAGIRHVDRNERKTLQHLAEFFEAVVAYAIIETEKPKPH